MSIMDQSWVKVQQKAFTRWVNAHLGKRGLKCEDIQTDFKSGINLLQLLEVIGEHTFGRYNKKPRMEIQMRENLQIALKFIESRDVKLTAIGAGDIFGGNLKLILGMIWTIILRFAIAEISVEELTAKEALLLWCQRKTADYDNVDIKEFTWSWQDGLGFCALIHKHRPDLIDYESLDPKNKEANLNLAFDVAEKELGLPKFLDAEDMIDVKPDERAVMTYLAEYFKFFSKGQKAENAGRRISKVAALSKEIDEMKESYEDQAGKLKEWIDKKIVEIPNYEFDNTLEGVEKLIEEFNDYKNNEKPPKLQEKTEVNTALNNLKIKIANNKRPAYTPPSGLTTEDIDNAWDQMEDKEKERIKNMNEELARQKKLKSLVEEFYRRVKKLESWAEKKEEYLNTKEEIDTLPLAKTKIKVLEAYHKEYELSKNRLNPTIDLGQEIIDMGYIKKDEIQEKMDELNQRWNGMTDLESNKNDQLQEDLKREEKKEELRKEFAKQAREYNRWQKDQVEILNDTIFGDDLESITDYKTKLDETATEITNNSDEKKEILENLDKELTELGSTDNKYSALTIDDIRSKHDQLIEMMKTREDAYNKELERQTTMEEKRKEFAQVADEFAEFLSQVRKDINNLSGEPEDMISAIKDIYQEGNVIDEKLQEVAKVDNEQKELEIRSNSHTKHTLPLLTDEAESLKEWIEKSIKRWEHEKVKKDKRKEFAEIADPYMDFLNNFVKEIGAIEGEPEERLVEIENYYQEGQEIEGKLEEVKKVDQECVELQTGNNPFTKYSFSMLINKTKQVHTLVANLISSVKEDQELKEKNIQQEKESQEAERIENLRLEYFEKAQDLNQFIDNFTEFLVSAIYVESSKAVEELIEKYNGFLANLGEKEGDLNTIKDLSSQLVEAGIDDFLGLPIETINNAWEEMNGQVENKKTQLDDELATQQKNEELCQQFADKAEEFQNYLKKQQEVVAEQLSGELAEQIKTVQNQLNEVEGQRSTLKEIFEIDQEIENRHVSNTQTTITSPDLQGLFNTVIDAFSKKIGAIEQEKIVKEGAKVTQEQLDEFKQLFELFDKDKKGALFPYEFSGVLNTLGDDLDEEEMKQVFDKYDEDKSGTIEFNEFVEFMISRVEDSDTLESSLESWKVIAKDKEYVTLQDMQMAGMSKDDLEYITSNMEPLEDGFDYKGWCNKVYGEN
ncbi:alpha-actinin [Anaeramoeba flamelloides]|uniref:Alpha-actinin n=1 Tax=Anaeramoeba flamelloides TaxID=1746091 RepID=A0ABQ8ZAF0_9EUKA|nr:alpha-actinin [Anaeramoeba flamelloides]